MNRIAFLIMNPGLPGNRNYAPTVEIAYNRVKDYLKSPVGGYWQDEEILELPRIVDVENLEKDFSNKMEAIGNADVEYSLIIFIGHGGAVDGDDCIQLEDGRIIPISTLTMPVSPNTKRTVVIDACRSYVAIPKRDLLLEQRMFSGEGQIQGIWCGDYYNRLIIQCKPHVELIQSTQYGQVAHGSSKGTAFTDALLETVKTNGALWNQIALNDSHGEYSCNYRDMENDIKNGMIDFGQIPQYTNTSDCAFPLFAVKRPASRILQGEIEPLL